MGKVSEAKVKKELRAALHEHGVYPTREAVRYPTFAGWYTMPVPSQYSESGIADFLGVIRGHYFEIEAKGRGAPHPQTGLQRKHESLIKIAGGIYILASSVEDVDILWTLT